MNAVFNVFLALVIVFVGVIAKKDETLYQPLKEDLPYIKCDVCQKAMSHIHRLIAETRETAPYKRVGEGVINEYLDMLCTPTNRTTGDWIRYYDIKEESVKGAKYLTLDQQDSKGKCTEECQTIARSCDQMFEEDIDLDDVSALLWKNKLNLNQFIDKVCKVMTGRCKQKKALPKSFQRKDHTFIELSEKDQKMEDMVEQMHLAGLGNSGLGLYSRDDLDEIMFSRYGDQDDEYYGNEQDETSYWDPNSGEL